MRSLILQQTPNKGGALTFTENIINFCKKNKIDPYLVCCNNQKVLFQKHNIEIIVSEKVASIKINTHPIRIFLKVISEIFLIWRLIKKVKPDVIFVSNIAQGTLLGSIIFKKPLLFFFHTYPDQKTDWFTHLYIKLFSSPKCLFITVSKYSRIKVARYLGVPLNSVKILYNYANEGIQSSKKTNRSVIRLLTIGHVTGIKNPELWFEIAVKIIENNDFINFYWAGDGDLLDLMRDKVKKYNYEKRIYFLGHQEDVKSLYNNCDIYFQPSIVESHGIAVVEAMYNRLPVVVSRAGGLPESVDHLVTGMVHDLNDFEGFVQSITWLTKNPQIRREFGEAGWGKCQKYFSKPIWEKKLSTYMKIVLDVKINR